MQLHKIRQYSFASLAKIATYRLVYKSILVKDKVLLSLRNKNYELVDNFSFDSSILKSIANQYKDFCVSEDVIDSAELILKNKIFLFGRWYDFDPKTDWLKDPIGGKFWPRDVFYNDASFVEKDCADVKYVLEINKLNHLVTLAQAYALSKEDKYARRIIDDLSDWNSNVPVEKTVANRIVMDIGYRCVNLIHILLLCYDSDFIMKHFVPFALGILLHHENVMWKRLTNRWFKSDNDNNHNVGELVSIYVTQVVLEQTLNKDYSYRKQQESQWLIPVLDKIISNEGTYIEQSGNYSKVVAEYLMLYDMVARACSDTNDCVRTFAQKDYLKRLVNYIYNISYDGRIHNFGDNDAAVVLLPFEISNGSAEHLFKYCKIARTYKSFSDSSQWVYSSTDVNRIRIFTRAGRFAYYVEGAYIHAHNDLLSVLISAKGSDIFIDKGCYYYNSGMDIKKSYVGISAHNTVHVKDVDMADFMPTGTKSYPTSSLIYSKVEDNFCHFNAEVTYKRIKHSREVKYERNLIIITDKMVVNHPITSTVEISYILSPSITATIIGKDTIALYDKANGNTFELCFRNVINVTVLKTKYAPHYGLENDTHMILCEVADLHKPIVTLLELNK